MLRYSTAGESHGKGLMTILEGFPSGLSIDIDFINNELASRQQGYGRGGRMKIEKDKADIIAGVHKGKTTGAPIGIFIKNKDFCIDRMPAISKPRPGHADLGGYLKYQSSDIRDILERSSARETASRVAVGAVCKLLLKKIKIEIISHVINIGGITVPQPERTLSKIKTKIRNSKLRCTDKACEKKMIEKIKEAMQCGDTLGGIFEVIAFGSPAGLGTCMTYDSRLDAILAMHIMSMPSVKAVSIGEGINAVNYGGSEVHDEIFYNKKQGYFRNTNNAGGIEGGMSNGSAIIIQGYMKPIPTLSSPLLSVDVKTKKPFRAAVERHDTCAVAPGGIVAEAVTAFALTQVSLRKFGSDSVKELIQNHANYMKLVKNS